MCYQNTANWIISNKLYEERKSNFEDKAKQIIETAAKNN